MSSNLEFPVGCISICGCYGCFCKITVSCFSFLGARERSWGYVRLGGAAVCGYLVRGACPCGGGLYYLYCVLSFFIFF